MRGSESKMKSGRELKRKKVRESSAMSEEKRLWQDLGTLMARQDPNFKQQTESKAT